MRRALCSASLLLAAVPALVSCGTPGPRPAPATSTAPTAAPVIPAAAANDPEGTLSPLTWPGEAHLANVRQLTFGGENAEAYWSPDGRSLVFQSTRPPHGCDQIFTLDVEDPKAQPRLVSTGKGRTTCAYYLDGGRRILYASTHEGSPACPPPPDMSQGYVWALYPDYDIFTAAADGSSPVNITRSPGYDAEATVSRDGSQIVFTSTRDGDIDLYSMRPDGSGVKRLTTAPGYDGGAFFSDDGQWIVYRAARPETPQALAEFRSLLARFLVRPSALEIRVMRSDGSGERQVTANGAANFAPFFYPGSHGRIVFCSNLADPRKRNFDLFAVNVDGTDLERITYNPTFDGFPMFSPDGRRLAFCSNRHNARPGETNVFVADWVP